MILEPASGSTSSVNNAASSHNAIVYLVRQAKGQLFCSESLERFNLYKRFVENTIMELGEDWRIESGLLAQEIMTEKGLTNDEFCIFNEFMAGFLRNRLGRQGAETSIQSGKMVSEEQGQQEFLKYFNKSLAKPTDHTPTTNDFSTNLTFKTLSLGFYITAGDIWTRTFNKYRQDVIEQKISSFGLDQEKKLSYFATVEIKLFGVERWFMQPERQVEEMLAPIENKIQHFVERGAQYLSSAIKLGAVVVNIEETVVNRGTYELKIRTFSLCTQFYLTIFLVWLIFSIKKSFNSLLFSPTCFIRYCDIIIGSKLFGSDQSSKTMGFHSIYRQFKNLCDDEWKKLMKDYMIALNDDKEVLKTLVKRIGEKVKEKFEREVQSKRGNIL